MTIKKFLISSGDGDTEESELDSSGLRTIGYDDVKKVVVLSNAHIINNLYVTGSVSGSFIGDGSQLTNLSASQITGLISSVETFNNITGSGTQSNPVVLKDNIQLITVTASFSGDGSQITGLTAAQISGIISSVSSSGNIIGDGTDNNPITLKNNIQLQSVTASFSGDGSNLYNIPSISSEIEFTESYGQIQINDIVAIGPNGVTRCEKTNDMLSNVIGVVTNVNGSSVFVKTFGQATVNFSGNYSRGSTVYVGSGGAVVLYSELVAGDYATQVGYVSGNGDNKIILQPRVYGQI